MAFTLRFPSSSHEGVMAIAQRKNGAAKARRKSSKASSSRKASARRRHGPARGALSRARSVMQEAVSPDVAAMQAEVRQLMSDLEDRLDRLNQFTRRGAGHAVDGVTDLMQGALSGAADRVRDNARAVSDDAAKISNQAINQIATQIDKRPLLTLAIAAGIGFAAGFMRRD
jgi:ElaB/YqjD/DUF883 family membrane-anchored ribosome-binding protein